jgi:hypothetical protein
MNAKKCGGLGIPVGFLDCEGTKPNFNLLPGHPGNGDPVDEPEPV